MIIGRVSHPTLLYPHLTHDRQSGDHATFRNLDLSMKRLAEAYIIQFLAKR